MSAFFSLYLKYIFREYKLQKDKYTGGRYACVEKNYIVYNSQRIAFLTNI
jgi:hypothetical protein